MKTFNLQIKYIFLPTNEIYTINSVREYANGNHKLYLVNENNSEDETAIFLSELNKNQNWKTKVN
jgi:hypothetical protein